MSLCLALGAVAQDYSTRYSSSETNTNAHNRFIKNIYLTGEKTGDKHVWDTSFTGGDEAKKMFYDKTDVIFEVVAGETLEAEFGYNGSWMHAYVYIDDNDNNGFDAYWTNSNTFGGDLKTFSFYYDNGGNFGYNSAGDYITGDGRSTLECPSFVAPTKAGTYRMRFKIDWNSIDPKGGETIQADGGTIVDVMLKVVEPAPLVESGKLYRIKNRCKDLSYLYATDNDHSNRGDRNGAYLSSTKRVIEGCQFLKSEDERDYKACEIRCDNATLADAGSIWKFEEAANGWKIKNMNNGSYIGATRNGSYVTFEKESDKAAIFSITKSGDYVTLYSADYNNTEGNYLHASGAGLMIWNASSTASHWTIEPATELKVTVSSADYASIYLPFDVTLPEGENLKAYAVTSTKGGYAKLEKMTTGIPANNGAILEGAGTHTLNIEETTSNIDVNLLLGSNVNTYVEGDAFVLANGENGVGLYKAALNKGENGADGETHFLNNANKAYLTVSSTQGANMLRFDFGGETTGVDAVEVENNVKTIYDLSGRKVSNMSAPGLYIVNGKKVLVK